MAARAPAAIGDLTDELLVRVFAALPPVTYSMRERCMLTRVCRRWRAVAAAPAAAPVWARAVIRVPADAKAQVRMLGWLATHGPRVRELKLAVQGPGGGRAWCAATAAMALAPGMLALELSCDGAGSAEWWRHLGRGLTRLEITGFGRAVLARAHERGGLPASLVELELRAALGAGPEADLPRALGALSRLTLLHIADSRCHPAAGEAAWQPLRELTALRSLRLSMDALEEVPAAVSALTALTSADFAACPALRGALEPLAPLAPSLRHLCISPARIRAPSALTALTALEELWVGFSVGELRAAGAAPLVEPGPHLHRLRALTVYTHYDDGDAHFVVDARRRLVEPLRAAAALTALEFFVEECHGPSPVLLNADRIDDLLAGKPALRRFALDRENALELDLDLAALRARHPAVEFELGDGDWWGSPLEVDS